jgi:hypothetical protein
MPARIVLAGLAVFGAITIVGWVLASVLAIVKFGVVLVVIAGVALWVVQAKGSR